MKYIQVYDEKKECWVLKKVEKVPEPVPEPSPWDGVLGRGRPDLYPWNNEFTAREMDIYRQWTQPLQARRMGDDNMRWTTTTGQTGVARRVTNTAPGWTVRRTNDVTPRVTVQVHDEFYDLENYPITTVSVGGNTPAPAAAPQPTAPALYFPGSGEPPDRDEPRENQHTRRLREYQQAIARLRRTR